MKIDRVWAMPPTNGETFTCRPIRDFVLRYLRDMSGISLDPFARNCDFAVYTNDLNLETSAQYHLDALDFLESMRSEGVRPSLVIFDPPYSPRQIKELYDDIGLEMGREGAWRTNGWKKERDVINDILAANGVVLSFGWNSQGMGKKRGFVIEEILLVCHGSGHNDTICMAERKVQMELF